MGGGERVRERAGAPLAVAVSVAPDGPQGPAVRRLGRRPALDGVRGAAVLLVICDHAHLPLRAAWIGVDLFFVLSGFLITSLLLEEHARGGRIALRAFYARRARRILPALALLTVAVAAVSLTAHQLLDRWPLRQQVAATWAFASNVAVWLGGAPLGAFTPTWSLACEEQFYLLWPPALAACLRGGVRPSGRGDPRRLAAGVLLAAVALAAAGAAVDAGGLVAPGQVFFDPLGRGAELLLGCALAVAWRHRLLPGAVEGAAAVPAALAGLALLAWRAPLGTQGTYLAAAACGGLLLAGLLGPRPGPAAAVFCARPLRYTGTVSYGLYLYNDAVSRLLHHNLPGSGWPVIAPLLLAGSFACAAPSHRYVEARFLRRRPPRAARGESPATA
ncbi:acyltransferase [Actinocrinis puniceicyclus]|uniref:Acyltransferase n=1 Tax=Actinocrinis puniceicyclus TaxID=977794 RepID=A0A8J7WST3_9ACTN|nr:acyltransferase [Actinocrinis puniceicyclus]MBS2966125.1 acyltransferase [Actinocrinis puniceicyclus]